ncbi:MAG: ABC transporter permease subunit [Anaerolineaceae bacterium]|jgi:ABC-type Na+ efflux pump permease subunit|nr:ABC transporter permease subunit [Anaerolineaceae bacterium]
MNWRTIRAIAQKDLYEARQNKSVWLPIMIVPLVFILILPAVILIMAGNPEIAASMNSDPETAKMITLLPAFMQSMIAGLNTAQSMVVLFLGYFFAPFFLILPIMFATVIASESFAGERERKTIEALLYTPASDAELFLGKVMASFVPAILITWASFLGYILVLNGAGYPIMGRLWFPMTSWYPMIFWMSPALSLLGVAATVLISSKMQTFMGAYQTSASLVVLVIALMVGQFTGVLALSPLVGMLVGLVLWLVDVLLTVLAVKSFNRSKILASEV